MLPTDHLRDFQNDVRRVRRLLARQVGFFGTGALPKTELDAIYELSFLKVFISFENELDTRNNYGFGDLIGLGAA